LAVVAAALVLLPTPGALAQKEQFARSKPHVNVSTIGNVQFRFADTSTASVRFSDISTRSAADKLAPFATHPCAAT
jgi:hypothetical protein